ncbi:MAG TPA: alpha-2-macroglobulin [Lentisphaeria bacterium]|nr:MAG: alpha-2-macroglobulin [Lentisphaerae bacterium GWF2_49_21]HBC88810.1 alpha-2-macroglobulin [Lentisphaeria bacterium]
MKKCLIALSVILSFTLSGFAFAADDTSKTARDKALKFYNQGNYKEAYDAFSKLALGEETVPIQVGEDLHNAVNCLANLNRQNEFDELVEGCIAKNSKNWMLLKKAAEIYMYSNHYGFMISGKYERGNHRGGGKNVNSQERDRIRSLQLFVQGMSIVQKDGTGNDKYHYYEDFARSILQGRGYNDSWQMQFLSDLSQLPDYEEGYYGHRGETKGAPVDENGNPVFYKVPASFADAKSDGERWRWLLEEAIKSEPGSKNSILLQYAGFLSTQFGVETMAYFRGYFGPRDDGDGNVDEDADKDESGPYAVHTLTEDETIAKLATGIKRFKLPDEYNYIKIYRKILADNDGFSASAINSLVDIFRNRRQYPKTADYLQESIKKYGDHNNIKKNQLEQIIGNWCQFVGSRPLVAGKPAEVELSFRNGKAVSFEAFKIRVPELLNDVREYLKSNPKQLEWEKVDINDIGQRIVWNNQAKYLGDKVATWEMKLQPRENHFNRTVLVRAPMKESGAYLVTAKLAEGNVSRIVVWLNDTVIMKKQGNNGSIYFVSDALTGAPMPKIKLDFFGYQQKYIDRKLIDKVTGRQYEIETKSFAVETNDDGLAIIGPEALSQNFQWIAETPGTSGKKTYLGFSGVWYGQYHDYEYNQTKTFIITDRPVYRPDQEINFKLWVRKAKYDQEDISDFASRSFTVIIRNPKNEEIYKKTLTADQFGGVEDKIKLPRSATLGTYGIYIEKHGGYGHFRLEEYKKPEYEVSIDAPKEPVKLGDKITATIKAKYYFGAPVTDAKVKYKVQRYSHNVKWYPPMYWDWFYGPGYWWFAGDYSWYPGWKSWGCRCPSPWWFPVRNDPPELVMENEVKIGEDGTVKVEIDSSIAKAMHGDQDHRYEITAEVVDQSRRTIYGKGSVIAARKPFTVYGWVDMGFYQVGDAVNASFAGRTVDGKPVKGTGSLKLMKIKYDAEGKPAEKEIQNWEVDTNEEGLALQQIKAAEKGQYRLSYTLKDVKGNSIEGGYIFTVHAQGDPDSDFRFNDIEVVNDKTEYRDGDTARILIKTNQADSTVLLFVRPANGIYLTPRVIRLKGKTALEEIKISKKDMPNFFVEAVTVSGGRIYTAVKELVVPPEKRVLNVDIIPSKEKYKPGEKAKAKIKITDFFGKPLTTGSVVVTIYDKSVEYISGGSNVPEIKDFFWKWRRSHNSHCESNLDKFFYNLLKEKEVGMGPLGVFGNITDGDNDGVAVGFDGAVRRGGAIREGKMMPSVVMPSSAPMKAKGNLAMMADKAEAAAAPAEAEAGGEAGGGGEEMGGVAVRKNFADTAFWTTKVTPDEKGEAEIELAMPENLTTWKVKAWSMTHGTKVGQGETEVITSKDFIVRLQAPRFFVEKDEVVLSAIVHNYYKDAKSAKVVLELDGGNLSVMDQKIKGVRDIKIEPGAEVRVDWRVSVLKEGEVTVRMKAVTEGDSDAMEMKFPVYVHGMMKMVPYSGFISAKEVSGSKVFEINVPGERRVDESRLEVRYSPTLAGAMVDALPYMCEYPYGCTEQTLNRFLPTVITQKVLVDMGLNLKDIREKRSNLNAQEIGDDKERAKQWKRFDREPVFDEQLLNDMIVDGLKALAFMQLSDGGWGWFSGWGEHSSPHTTATVVHGLQVARKNDVKVDEQMLKRGIDWLKRYQDEQVARTCRHEYPEGETCKKDHPKHYRLYADNIDALVYMILVDAGIKNDDMKFLLYRDRTKISVYAKAMFGIALQKQNDAEKLQMIMRNIEQFLVQDDENQTAYLNIGNEGYWWYWYGSEFEAHAYYLKLLALTDPKSEKASRLVKYLLNNRKHSTYWNSTRDTALCIEAMADYIRASGEDKPEMVVEVLVDGELAKVEKVNAQNLFSYDNKFLLEGKNLSTGKHKIEIRKTGRGPIYTNMYFSYFSLEDYIRKAGLEIKVDRKYYKLKEVDKKVNVAGARGQALSQKVEKYQREELADLATLKSGDLVEIELTIQSKNDYEYLIFEDMKPAGFEPCEVRSGYNGNEMGAYVEFRDERVCFFTRVLARGTHSVSYRMKAEIPGKFSALPTKGSAMYAPELKANSDEIKLNVQD